MKIGERKVLIANILKFGLPLGLITALVGLLASAVRNGTRLTTEDLGIAMVTPSVGLLFGTVLGLVRSKSV